MTSEKNDGPGTRLVVDVPYEDFARLAMRYGDWKYLAWYLRLDNTPIPGDLRRYLADVLAGKKRSNNRSPSVGKKFRDVRIALYMVHLMRGGAKKTDAENYAAEQFGVGRNTVQRAWKNEGAIVERHAVFGPRVERQPDGEMLAAPIPGDLSKIYDKK
jgi:hypothetical protein